MNIHNFSTLRVSGGAGLGGGALGFVPDWSKVVAISGTSYTAPADGVIYAFSCGINGVAMSGAMPNYPYTAIKKGSVAGVSNLGGVFVPFSARKMGALNYSAASVVPPNGVFSLTTDGCAFIRDYISINDVSFMSVGLVFLSAGVSFKNNSTSGYVSTFVPVK